jgi:hypothetical protein
MVDDPRQQPVVYLKKGNQRYVSAHNLGGLSIYSQDFGVLVVMNLGFPRSKFSSPTQATKGFSCERRNT